MTGQARYHNGRKVSFDQKWVDADPLKTKARLEGEMMLGDTVKDGYGNLGTVVWMRAYIDGKRHEWSGGKKWIEAPFADMETNGSV